MLAALAAGREVIVSRGELVEIGGGFRVPDVMAQSGARLREVGTTNRTRDRRLPARPSARTRRCCCGCTGRTSASRDSPSSRRSRNSRRSAASAACRWPRTWAAATSGCRARTSDAALDALLGGEPRVQASLAAGIDIVCFSGDKLLGGPQAGIIVGRRALVARVRRHPLMRALRVDKLTYAALEATLGRVRGRPRRPHRSRCCR